MECVEDTRRECRKRLESAHVSIECAAARQGACAMACRALRSAPARSPDSGLRSGSPARSRLSRLPSRLSRRLGLGLARSRTRSTQIGGATATAAGATRDPRAPPPWRRRTAAGPRARRSRGDGNEAPYPRWHKRAVAYARTARHSLRWTSRGMKTRDAREHSPHREWERAHCSAQEPHVPSQR